MATHASLTGGNLHEPKGVSSAAANTVYVANGSGSGTWQTLTSSSINTGSILNVNKYKFAVQMDDISTADFILVPVPSSATLTKCTVILNNAITSADSTLTFTNSTGPSTLGSLAIANSGSSEGSRFTFTPGANNAFTAGSYLKIANDGGSSTTCKATLFLEWTLT